MLLDGAESAGTSHIISWLPTGNAFKVHDKKEFAEVVMPKYFQSNKYKSFQRNLNLWCFQTLTKDPNKGAIFHPYFIRGEPDRCHLMKRIKVKKNSMSQKISLSELRASSASASTSSGATTLKASNSKFTMDSMQPFDPSRLALLAGASTSTINLPQQNLQQSLLQCLGQEASNSPLIQSAAGQNAHLQQAILNSLLLNHLTGGGGSNNMLQQPQTADDRLKVQIGLALLASANSGMQFGPNVLANAGMQHLNPFTTGNFSLPLEVSRPPQNTDRQE